MKQPEVQILDTTLRDGSYVIDFQFTAQDTAMIASTLEFAGIPGLKSHTDSVSAQRVPEKVTRQPQTKNTSKLPPHH